MRKVKYRVGRAGHGLHGEGELIDSHLMAADTDGEKALLFFPCETNEPCDCGCVVICKRDYRYKSEEVYGSIDEDCYINLEDSMERKFKGLLPKVKVKRKSQPRKYFIAYRKGDKCVWGTGYKKSTARRDAIKNIKDFSFQDERAEDIKLLVTVECSKEVYDYVQVKGGCYVDFFIRKGFAKLKRCKSYSI